MGASESNSSPTLAARAGVHDTGAKPDIRRDSSHRMIGAAAHVGALGEATVTIDGSVVSVTRERSSPQRSAAPSGRAGAAGQRSQSMRRSRTPRRSSRHAAPGIGHDANVWMPRLWMPSTWRWNLASSASKPRPRDRTVHEQRHAELPELGVHLHRSLTRHPDEEVSRSCRTPSRGRCSKYQAQRVVGEYAPGSRRATSWRSPTSNASPSFTHRQRSSGKLKQFVWRSTIAHVHTRRPRWGTPPSPDRGCRCGRRRHATGRSTGHPGHEREHLFEPFRAVRRCAGVDDHRLLAADHERVDVDEQRLPARRLHLTIRNVSGAISSGGKLTVGASGANLVTVMIPSCPASTLEGRRLSGQCGGG